MTVRRLVVSGDDFGAAAEVNAGIVKAHTVGILTSTSLMVTGAAAAAAIELARAHPTLAVGLHLVLVQGRPAAPASQIPMMVRGAGEFGRQSVLTALRYAWEYVLRRGKEQLRREISTQLEMFLSSGLPLAHLDGHLNMHLHPMVLAILLELAPQYGIRAIRLSREELGPALRYDRRHALRKTLEGGVFHALAAYAGPRLRAAGIVVADRVYGMHQTGHLDEAYLLHLLAALPEGSSEIYGHPALGRPAALARDQQSYDHAGEVDALTSPRVRALIERAGIELTNYQRLVGV